MRVPSPLNLLLTACLAVVTFATPVFACVCDDGTTTVQAFTHFCDDDAGEPCDESCEVSRFVEDGVTVGDRVSVPTPPDVESVPPAWVIDLTVLKAFDAGLIAAGYLVPPSTLGVVLRAVILIV
jgi:hypothetical protein